jgi:hypothetical protein
MNLRNALRFEECNGSRSYKKIHPMKHGKIISGILVLSAELFKIIDFMKKRGCMGYDH